MKRFLIMFALIYLIITLLEGVPVTISFRDTSQATRNLVLQEDPAYPNATPTTYPRFYVQFYKSVDDIINPLSIYGQPTGDDVALTNTGGNQTLALGPTGLWYANGLICPDPIANPVPTVAYHSSGAKVYIRVFNSTSIATATRYFSSTSLYTILSATTNVTYIPTYGWGPWSMPPPLIPLLNCYQVSGNVYDKTYLQEQSEPFQVFLSSVGTLPVIISNVYWKSGVREFNFVYDLSNLDYMILLDSTFVSVTFAPLSEGALIDTLCIANNSVNQPLLQIPFSGRGYRLHAGFSFTPDNGDVPSEVSFADFSTEDIITWAWDFGDGNSSTLQNPSHLFTSEGNYPVELTVSDGVHFDSVTQNVTVLAHPYISSIYNQITDIGLVYIGDSSSTYTITLNSVGTDTLYVNNVHWRHGRPGLSFSIGETNIPILPSESETIDVWFAPTQTGVFSDSLIIETNAENTPVLKFGFNTSADYVPPKLPDNVLISMIGYNAHISWSEVTETIYNSPIIPDGYIVLFSEDDNIYSFLGATTDLQYVHLNIGELNTNMFYRVVAYKM
jgi:PKD repeat protein